MATAPAAHLSDLLVSFQLELEAQGKAPRTVVLYSQSVRLFWEWLEEQGRTPTADQFTRAAVRAWMAGLSQTRQPGTVRTRQKGLQRFARWCVAEGEVATDPTAGLDVARGPSKPVPVLTDVELQRLFKSCAPGAFPDRRDEAIMRLLMDCGLRVSELTGLQLDDIDLRDRSAVVTGKGSKVRPVYFGTRTGRALDRYLRLRRNHPYAHTSAVFVGKRGPLTPDGVRHTVEQRGKAAGVLGLHPHQFRHTFAHDYLMNGGQERDLMRLAGWTTPTMLERYGASAADARAREAARRMGRGDRV